MLELDALVVGAGFSGLYMLHRLRQLGVSTLVVDAAGDVGGTWYWNRYPGARCDIPTTDYTFTFDPELENAWTWSEKYATQPEILRYLGFVADRYDLRRDISFGTRVLSASWDEHAKRWLVDTDEKGQISCRYYIAATGCLSLPKEPDIEGFGRFGGEVYFTGRWPHEPVDFTGKKVAVIGTGSSAIQSIPLIAEQASQLTVFQRTPNFACPAANGPAPEYRVEALAADRDAYREAGRYSKGGMLSEVTDLVGATVTEEVLRDRFEAAWERGELFAYLGVLADQFSNPASNEMVAELFREKIRSRVDDPEIAETLSPRDHYLGTKRLCLETNYYETYNLPHVRLVDLRKHPIATITERGIDTVDESMEFDAIVFATGFDAMTGPAVAMNVSGREGQTLGEKWQDGPSTYLGLMTSGFPNFFTITGPGSPSVFTNMAASIEQHVDLIADCVAHMDSAGHETVEPTATAEAGWNQHVQDCAAVTLLPTANSWYMGANVPGKPRVLYAYIGGLDRYRRACEEVVERDWLGFAFSGPEGTSCNDGVIRTMQLDVSIVLETMEALGLPPLESLSPEDARAFMDAASATRPPGPEVGAITDGTLPAGSGHVLPYRLYSPPTPGPHRLLVYFHGGGFVFGSATSDEPLCRDLCVRADVAVLSVDYRHAPEHRFPAAVEDAVASLRWAAANPALLGAVAGEVAVAGWSAGGNLAAIACQQLAGSDSRIAAQLLICPLIDCDFERQSYRDNGEGFLLTLPLMRWFRDHYLPDIEDLKSPLASPLRAESLAGLPPAVVVTAEFDPLRDEGDDYAVALSRAGVPVTHIRARGHIHTSLTMVDVVVTGAPVRAEMAAALRSYLPELTAL